MVHTNQHKEFIVSYCIYRLLQELKISGLVLNVSFIILYWLILIWWYDNYYSIGIRYMCGRNLVDVTLDCQTAKFNSSLN